MKDKRIYYYILPSLIILAGYFSFFVFYDRTIYFDWGFFNSLSHLLKSIILEYHRFPVHDPWVCGGVDILSRPQNWVFSPFIISTILFPPYIANLFSLIFMSFVGAWGMYKLLKHYEVSDTVSIYCSLLFINSSWFGLHIAEGHIAYRSMFLLPVVIYLVLTLTNIKRFVVLSLIISFFLVDGGIYTFIYSIVVVFFLILLNMVPIKTFIAVIAKNWLTFTLTIIAFLLVTSTKIIPVITSAMVPGRFGQYHMSPKEIALSLFYPLQTIFHLDLWDRNFLRFHEYGCYIGVLSLFIIFWYSRKRAFWKDNFKEIILLLFFFWLATGIGGEFNPGTLLRKVPIISNAHLESRYFVIFLLFYIVVLARVIDRNISSKVLLIAILAILSIEFLVVRNYSSYEAFYSQSKEIDYPHYITKRKIDKTVENIQKPNVYYEKNIASKECYEAIQVPTGVRHTKQEGYRGEVHASRKSATIEVLEFSPGYIEAKYRFNKSGAAEFYFNTNSNGAWVVNEPHEVFVTTENLLAVKVKRGDGIIKLRYQPSYLKYIIIFYISGILVYLFVIRKVFFVK